MGRLVIIIALVGLLGVGLIVSFRDWKKWNYEETKNFGHGPGELYTPAELFTEHYGNQFVGIKFNYPGRWKQIANPKFQISNPKVTLEQVLNGSEMETLVQFDSGSGQKITMSVGWNKNETGLADIVNKKSGKNTERAYINSDWGGWTVVKFVDKDKTVEKAYAMKEKRLFEIDFEYATDQEMKLQKTYEELVRGIIII